MRVLPGPLPAAASLPLTAEAAAGDGHRDDELAGSGQLQVTRHPPTTRAGMIQSLPQTLACTAVLISLEAPERVRRAML